jgi:hypothetical protein
MISAKVEVINFYTSYCLCLKGLPYKIRSSTIFFTLDSNMQPLHIVVLKIITLYKSNNMDAKGAVVG